MPWRGWEIGISSWLGHAEMDNQSSSVTIDRDEFFHFRVGDMPQARQAQVAETLLVLRLHRGVGRVRVLSVSGSREHRRTNCISSSHATTLDAVLGQLFAIP